MVIVSFLTPKKEVQYLYEDFTIRQALEKMEFHKYGTIPVLERATGKYLYSLSEGDFLWHMKKSGLTFEDLSSLPLSDVKPSRALLPVPINASMEELYALVEKQNYVPILDDLGVFIGIVTRKKVMREYSSLSKENKAKDRKE